jgi:DNA-binding CsgD family transcriptional regulator/tetratricopeptide (TPR) repeat protein
MMEAVVPTIPLLERHDQIARLRVAIDQAQSGGGKLVVVTGEAGVGKTALLDSIRDCGEAVRVWTGSCERLFTPRPLGPLADIASKAGGRLGAVVGRGAPVHEVFPVLLEELSSTATVMVIEDVHWADEATLDVIVLLARRMAATCSLAIITSRDELPRDHPLRLVLGDLASAGVERLRLSPLSLHAVRLLAEPHAVDAEELFQRTGGNPFYVTEVLATGGGDLPPSVRDAVLARAAGLDPHARSLLDAVAIVTGTVPLGLVAAIGGADAARLDVCLSSGMLVESSDGIAFRHDLARQAIADEIEPLRRASLHALALRLLRAAGADPARLAHHAEATCDAEAVAEFAPIAAAEAAGRGAHREAAAQFRRALRFTAHLDVETRAALLERGAREVYVTDQFDEAIAWLRDAVQLRHQSGDILREGDALRQLSTVQRCGGRSTDAHSNGAEAVALLETQPAGPELAAAYANVAMLALNASDIDIGIATAQTALDLAARCDDRNVHVHALNTMGVLRLLVGDERGRAALLDSLEISLEEGRDENVARAYVHLADLAQRHRRWDFIDPYYTDGSQYCSEHGLDLWARYLHVYYARTELDRGRWDAATSAVPASVDVPGTPLARITALVILGLVRARRGDPEHRSVLDEAARLAERSGELQWLGPVTAACMEAAWLSGRPMTDIVDPGAVLQACISSRAAWWAGEIAWWRRCAGIDEPAPECAAEPWALLLAGRPGEAAAAWQRLGCPYEEAVALSHSDGPADLRGAFELFDSLGAQSASDLLVRRMRTAGVTRIPRGARATTRANPAGLTTREVDVLRLIARGLRNSEIADELVVSAKTIDHHVSSVLTKLGVSSRGAAAREAARLGVQDGEEPSAR